MTDPTAAPLTPLPWWQLPLATLDTETTGTNVDTDRIVTAVHAVYEPDGQMITGTDLLLNPGVDIPEAATKVHGITTEHARENGRDPGEAIADLMEAIETAWADDIPLVVYNAAFDLTLIDREARRHLGVGLAITGPIIDPLVVDRQVDRYVKGAGQRQLKPTCERYGVEITDWHTASADAFAAQALARAIGQRHDAQLPSHMGDLWRWQRSLKRDQAQALQDYFAGIGRTNDDGSPIVIDGQWPMQVYAG